MVNKLVKFPNPGNDWEKGEWEVTAGPGMYVLAVVPRGVEPDPCAVGSAILLLRPNGKLLTPAVPLWSTEENRSDDALLIEEAARLFEEKGERVKAAAMRAQLPVADLSVEVLHATRVGATERTLKSRKTGEYWQATWKDLTPSGSLHLLQVHTCFVDPPLLLTFLGDGEDEG